MSPLLILKLVGSLALLMYGMKSMSESLQKMAGSQLRHVLQAMTKNRFTGMITGAFVTASVQSSTATTVMTVSFVNAGLLTLAQAISIIMGANIGTTFTAWIMSAGFSFNITDFVWPALFGISFLLLGLGTLKSTGTEMHLENIPAVIQFFESFDDSYLTYIIFLFIGGIMTVCVQSLAAVMAITMALCSTGVMPIYLGIALVMGENIGTTVTSNVAALTANIQARRAAFAHMFFNIFGVIWALCIFRIFINFVCGIVGFPTEGATAADAKLLPTVLATFHTTFNVINTAILIWFIPYIEQIVCRVITKTKGKEEEEEFRLRFISSGFMQTPELSVLEAEKEIRSFSSHTQKMFHLVCDLLKETNKTDFVKKYSRIEKYEAITDNIELEIGQYLNEVSSERLSDATKAKIRAMLREISEIESIGDSCYNIARSLNRKISGKEDFTEEQYSHITQMMGLADQSLTEMNTLMNGYRESLDINKVFNIETEINNFRNQLKTQNVSDMDAQKYTYAIGTIYIDIISECEKLGYYVVNVAEARMGIRQRPQNTKAK